MGQTQVRTHNIADGGVNRDDLDITTAGKAVVRKILQGTGVTISSTGVDSGTGDVTINTVQDIATTAIPTFAGLTLTGNFNSSGMIKNVASLSGFLAYGVVNTNTAQTAGYYFAEINNGSAPAYFLRYGSTHSTYPERLLIVNASTVGHMFFQSGKTSGTAFEWYANGATRATIDTNGYFTMYGTQLRVNQASSGLLFLSNHSGAPYLSYGTITNSFTLSNTTAHWFTLNTTSQTASFHSALAVSLGALTTTSITASGVVKMAGFEISTNADMQINAYYSGGWKYRATGYAADYYQNSAGDFVFLTAPSGTANNAITFTSRFTILNGGGVKVGTNTLTESIVGYLSTGLSNTIMFSTAEGTHTVVINKGIIQSWDITI